MSETPLTKKKKKNINLDLIRCVATFTVICVHFFLNNGFYKEPVVGGKMYMMATMRTCFMVCVPLFVILSGYLVSKKELTKSYYKGIIRILGIYIIASLFCIAYKAFAQNIPYDFFRIVKEILEFKGANYSWYINMYISLFLLIPFLNLIYNNLKNKKEKMILIATLFFITSIPSILNVYGVNIAPTWWVSIWPLLYYFIGAFLREYPPKIKSWKVFLLFLIILTVSSTYNIFMSKGDIFIKGQFNDWMGWQNVLSSTCLFVTLKNLKLEKLPHFIKWIIQKISYLSLAIYLCSWIGDKIVYTRLNATVPVMQDRLSYFFICVFSVFLLSILFSALANIIYELLAQVISLFKRPKKIMEK